MSPRTLSFSAPEMLENPYPQLARWREEWGPVAWDESKPAWVVTGYAEAHEALKSKALSVRTAGARMAAAGPEFAPLAELVAGFLTRLDPPQHTRLRQLLMRAFTPRTVAAMEEAIRGRVAGLLADRRGGRLELMEALAIPLPVGVICDMLGVERSDQGRVKGWSDALGGIADLDPDVERLRLALQASREFAAYVDRLVERHREHRSEALLARLVEVEQEGDKLSREELFGLCQVLLIAGQETTTCLLGNACHLLSERQDLQERLRQAPELVPSFLEECLRWESPVQIRTRLALADFQLGAATIRAGQSVQILLGAANRDAAVFEAPDEFRLERKPNRHLAFGEGPHFCLGSALARLEARLALDPLLAGGVLRADPDGPPRRSRNFSLRGFESLPLSW